MYSPVHKLHCIGKLDVSRTLSHFLTSGNHTELQLGTQIDLTFVLLTVFQNQQCKYIY